MELTLWVEQRDSPEVGDNVRGALEAVGAWPNSGVRISARHQTSRKDFMIAPVNLDDGLTKVF
jgi:hypothetical protein